MILLRDLTSPELPTPIKNIYCLAQKTELFLFLRSGIMFRTILDNRVKNAKPFEITDSPSLLELGIGVSLLK